MSDATTAVSARLAGRIRRETRALARHLKDARGADSRAVHQARVSSRRLREMLAIAEGVPGEDRTAAKVRRLGRRLGPLRELEVSRGVWREPAHTAAWPQVVLSALERLAELEFGREAAAARRAIDRHGGAGLAKALDAMAGDLVAAPRDRMLRDTLLRSSRERRQALLRATARAGTIYAAGPLHEVRIATKKLRYAVELARDLAGVPAARALRRLRAQQDLLGRLHDLQVVQERVLAIGATQGVARGMLRATKVTRLAIEAECRELHAQFVAGSALVLVAVAAVNADAAIRLMRPKSRRMTARATRPGEAVPASAIRRRTRS